MKDEVCQDECHRAMRREAAPGLCGTETKVCREREKETKCRFWRLGCGEESTPYKDEAARRERDHGTALRKRAWQHKESGDTKGAHEREKGVLSEGRATQRKQGGGADFVSSETEEGGQASFTVIRGKKEKYALWYTRCLCGMWSCAFLLWPRSPSGGVYFLTG